MDPGISTEIQGKVQRQLASAAPLSLGCHFWPRTLSRDRACLDCHSSVRDDSLGSGFMDVCVVILCKRVLGFARRSFEGTRSLDKVFSPYRLGLGFNCWYRLGLGFNCCVPFSPPSIPYRGLNNLSEVLWYFTVDLLYWRNCGVWRGYCSFTGTLKPLLLLWVWILLQISFYSCYSCNSNQKLCLKALNPKPSIRPSPIRLEGTRQSTSNAPEGPMYRT